LRGIEVLVTVGGPFGQSGITYALQLAAVKWGIRNQRLPMVALYAIPLR
jgi:hypothetical protein